jgi:hypothetical protein
MAASRRSLAATMALSESRSARIDVGVPVRGAAARECRRARVGRQDDRREREE